MIVHVFGKTDCPKCEALRKNIDFIIRAERWDMFKVAYHNLMNAKDLTEFCMIGQLNPTKIPAFIVSDDDGEYMEDDEDYALPEWRIYGRFGCQTDWRKSAMNGNISFEQITGELRRSIPKENK